MRKLAIVNGIANEVKRCINTYNNLYMDWCIDEHHIEPPKLCLLPFLYVTLGHYE